MNYRELLQQASSYFPLSLTPQLDLEILLSHVCEVDRAFLYANPRALITQHQWNRLEPLVERRKVGEPMAYLIGRQEFWSLDLAVSSEVLVPRADTEILVEVILSLLASQETIKIADLGTGCGAIALALLSERPNWQIIATDLSLEALAIAKRNAERLMLNSIAFYQGDWCRALGEGDFDVIVSNPPYLSETEWQESDPELKFEPKKALLAGKRGMDSLEEIITTAKEHLKHRGYLVLEHGSKQGENVRERLRSHGYQAIFTQPDMSGQERATRGQKRQT